MPQYNRSTINLKNQKVFNLDKANNQIYIFKNNFQVQNKPQ